MVLMSVCFSECNFTDIHTSVLITLVSGMGGGYALRTGTELLRVWNVGFS